MVFLLGKKDISSAQVQGCVGRSAQGADDLGMLLGALMLLVALVFRDVFPNT